MLEEVLLVYPKLSQLMIFTLKLNLAGLEDFKRLVVEVRVEFEDVFKNRY